MYRRKGKNMKTNPNSSGISMAIASTLRFRNEGLPLIEKPKPSEFTIKVANTLEERADVFRLAYQVYLGKGFLKANPNEWLVNDYDADEETTILVVKDKNNKLVGSVTLVFDGYSKLPAQKIYGKEIQLLRSVSEKVAEISRLIINPEYRNSKEILVLMFNYLAIYASSVMKYTCLAIEVNPRHKLYYKELLGFTEIGGEKPCPIVENAPATLLHVPLSKLHSEVIRCQKLSPQDKKERTLYQYFLKPEQTSLVAHYLKMQTKPMSAEEKLYFGFSESGISRIACV